MPLQENTSIDTLKALGATTLSDIPLEDLLQYVQHVCLNVAKDMVGQADPTDRRIGEIHTQAACHVGEALEALNVW